MMNEIDSVRSPASSLRLTGAPGVLAALALVVIGAAAPPARAQRTVTLCDSENPPYSIGSEDGGPAEGGRAVALVQEVFRHIDGVEVEVRLLPWSRCLQEAREGRKDGVLKLLRSDERAEWLEFTDEPLYPMKMVFFFLAERFPDGLRWESLSDLSAYTLGVVEGSSSGAILDEAVRTGVLRTDAASVDKQNILKLAAGRVDLFADDLIMGTANVRDLGLGDRITSSDQTISTQPIHLGLSKASWAAELRPRIDAILAGLWADGTADRILAGE